MDGRPHPLTLLIEKGESIDLNDYLRPTDSTVWALLDLWRDHPDPILQDLCGRLWTRNLFKAIPIKDDIHGNNLYERVLEETQKNSPIVKNREEAGFYVALDVSRRNTYDQEDAIWLFGENTPTLTLQQDNSSRIIQVVREQHLIQYLMVPVEIEQKLM